MRLRGPTRPALDYLCRRIEPGASGGTRRIGPLINLCRKLCLELCRVFEEAYEEASMDAVETA